MSVSYQDILKAADCTRGVAARTPLLRFPLLDAMTGGEIHLKAEIFQRTGSFKFRGAFNRLADIPEADRHKGVVACSSGNHAQGVAAAARLLGIPATIVMPADTPALKLERTRALGAEVVLYDRATQDREAIARSLYEPRGAAFAHPFDDPLVIAGQGTVGLEIIEDMPDPDAVLVCCSGGGLSAGVALAVKNACSTTQIHTVEPVGFDDHVHSFAAGERVENSRKSGSVCDALLAASPGRITFPITRALIGQGVAVSDEEALQAVAFAARELKLVVEPGGAVALAAILFRKIPLEGRRIVAVLSGGNIDPEMLLKALGKKNMLSADHMLF